MFTGLRSLHSEISKVANNLLSTVNNFFQYTTREIMKLSILSLALLAFVWPSANGAIQLSQIATINPDTITVSGISSGGAFATQVHFYKTLAFSL